MTDESIDFQVEDISNYNLIRADYAGKRYNVVEIDFKIVTTKSGILDLFSNQLQFPSYFGRNWDALWDCIKDLEWLREKNTAVLIKNSSKLKDQQSYTTLIDILRDATPYWRKYGVDFVTIIFNQNKKPSGE